MFPLLSVLNGLCTSERLNMLVNKLLNSEKVQDTVNWTVETADDTENESDSDSGIALCWLIFYLDYWLLLFAGAAIDDTLNRITELEHLEKLIGTKNTSDEQSRKSLSLNSVDCIPCDEEIVSTSSVRYKATPWVSASIPTISINNELDKSKERAGCWALGRPICRSSASNPLIFITEESYTAYT